MRLSPRCRSVLSGRADDAGARCLRGILRGASAVYGLGIAIRNRGYDRAPDRAWSSPAPVISVGNITAGGTGKTPMVAYLAKGLTSRGYRPAVLTRGYRGESTGGSDEVAMLRASEGEFPIVVNADRCAGAHEAVTRFGADVLLMDDGFQHRRLARAVDLVLIDCLCPFGYGALIPRGLLREPVSSLSRAGVVVLTRSDAASDESKAAIGRTIAEATDAPIVESIHQPVSLLSADDRQLATSELAGRSVGVFCGLGNPEGFLSTVRGLGATITEAMVFDDHHCYTTADIECLEAVKKAEASKWLLTSEKDWGKVSPLLSESPLRECVYRLQVEMAVTSGEDRLWDVIERAIQSALQVESR